MVELKSRLDTLLPDGVAAAAAISSSADPVVGREAEDALIALGYKPSQAADAVQQAQNALSDSGRVDTEQLVTWYCVAWQEEHNGYRAGSIYFPDPRQQ